MADQQTLEAAKRRLTEAQLELQIAQAEYELAVINRAMADLKASLLPPFAFVPPEHNAVRMEVDSSQSEPGSPMFPASPLHQCLALLPQELSRADGPTVGRSDPPSGTGLKLFVPHAFPRRGVG